METSAANDACTKIGDVIGWVWALAVIGLIGYVILISVVRL